MTEAALEFVTDVKMRESYDGYCELMQGLGIAAAKYEFYTHTLGFQKVEGGYVPLDTDED